MVSKLFVLELLTVKAAQEVNMSHSGLVFVVYEVSLKNNSNLEYIKIQTSPLTPVGVHTPYVHMHANRVTPYGMIRSSVYNMGDIGEFLNLAN